MNKILYIIFVGIIVMSCCCEKKSGGSSKIYDENQKTDEPKGSTAPKVGLGIGDLAPEINMPDTKGKNVSLSSLKGKIVLIDFWASWCGPCRGENPNNVKLYSEFKDKGFEIYGVSLDRSKEDWISAIKQDGLEWIHVSDLGYWNSSVVTQYRLEGIPSTVLLDKEGKIIARDLRGEQLASAVRNAFGN